MHESTKGKIVDVIMIVLGVAFALFLIFGMTMLGLEIYQTVVGVSCG